MGRPLVGSRSLLLDPLRSPLRAGAVRRQRTSLAYPPGSSQPADLTDFPLSADLSILGMSAPHNGVATVRQARLLVCSSRAASRGISILQQTPPDANARSTEPPSSRGMRLRMMLTPYLKSDGAITAGPRISRHWIDRVPFSPRSQFQFTSTRPCGVDSAPCFAALVTSSCSTISNTLCAAYMTEKFDP